MNRNRVANVLLAYAADDGGTGLAYATVTTGDAQRVVRIPFSVRRLPLSDGRELGYAAVSALAGELARRGLRRLRLRLEDAAVVADLAAPTGKVPPALGMPYVQVRCALNGFASARVERADARETADLRGRASAELLLRSAA